MTLPAFDAVASNGNILNTKTLAWAHTVGASNDRILFVVTCHYTDGQTITEITLGTDSLDLKDEYDAGNKWQLQVWVLLNPPSGAKTITITWDNNSVRKSAASISFSGLNIASLETAIGALQKHGDGSSPFGPYSITSAPGEMVLDLVAYVSSTSGGGGMIGAVTEGPDQVEAIQEERGGSGSAWRAVGISYREGDASVDMGWTFDNSGYIRSCAYSLKPAEEGRARSIKYNANTLDPKRRVFDNQGRVVLPSLVEADNWMRNEGPYFMTPKKHTSLIEADSIGYLEAIKFRSGGRTQYITETETLLESLFRRLGARGA